jgi:hypothetical protein
LAGVVAGAQLERGGARRERCLCAESSRQSCCKEVTLMMMMRLHCTGIAASRGRPIPAGSHKLATHTPGARRFLLPHPPAPCSRYRRSSQLRFRQNEEQSLELVIYRIRAVTGLVSTA